MVVYTVVLTQQLSDERDFLFVPQHQTPLFMDIPSEVRYQTVHVEINNRRNNASFMFRGFKVFSLLTLTTFLELNMRHASKLARGNLDLFIIIDSISKAIGS